MGGLVHREDVGSQRRKLHQRGDGLIMVRKIYVACLCLVLALTIASGTSQGREVLLDTDALRVETIDGQQVMVFSVFRAESDDYIISGVSGRFTQRTNEMVAIGSIDEPAVLQRESPNESMLISAVESIVIHLDDERLIATGDVLFESDETRSQSDLLRVDTKDRIWESLADFVESMPAGDARDLIMQFFDDLAADTRIVLLQGNVHVETEDATLSAAWVAFEESDSESFVSAAYPGTPIHVRVQLEETEDN